MMADGQQGVSSLPLPPMQYVSLYTDDNVKLGRAPPPPSPAKDTFQMFGQPIHMDDLIIRPLESQGLRRLYPMNYEHKRELKKLNQSILINFLDLLDIIIKAPDSPKRADKMEDLKLLFIHIHHLINEFRPHQARETLRVMMEVQKKERLEIADRFHVHLKKVQELLQNALSELPDESALESKLLIKTEPMDQTQTVDTASKAADSIQMESETVDPRDRMMCDIVDAIN